MEHTIHVHTEIKHRIRIIKQLAVARVVAGTLLGLFKDWAKLAGSSLSRGAKKLLASFFKNDDTKKTANE